MKKESPILGKIVRKRLFVPFEILALDILTKNYYKLDKSFRKPLPGTFSENPNGFCDIRFWDLCFNAFVFNTTLYLAKIV